MATQTSSRSFDLDFGRITAGAGAIAVNVAGLMLLMVPLAVPPMLERMAPEVPVIFIEPKKKDEPKKDPVEVEIARPQPSVAEPRPVERPAPQPMPDTTSQPVEGDIVVPPTTGESTATVAEPGPAGPTGPMQGASLEVAIGPAPPYPREALRDGNEGTVVLRVLVDVDGRPIDVTVERSSGHRMLDAAARRHVLAKWTFRPAIRDGRPVQAVGLLPVEFSLD